MTIFFWLKNTVSHKLASQAELSKMLRYAANFKGADLTDCHFDVADLSRADFTTSKNITQDKLKRASSYEAAKLPPGLD